MTDLVKFPAARLPNARLLYENGPNWRYATKTHIADPAIWYQSPQGETHILVSELEVALMRKTAKVNHIHAFGDVRKAQGGKPLTLIAMIQFLMAQEETPPPAISVPSQFPAALAEKLITAGIPLHISQEELFFPARAIKSKDEIKQLRLAQRLNEEAFHHAYAILHDAKIRKDNTLTWQGHILTAEVLQGEMNALLARNGCQEFHNGPIVSCGLQGAMPHSHGHGPLRANQFIVIDSFPRHPNGYWGDLTRTVLKGKPTPWHVKMYEAVLNSQKIAFSMLKPGANGRNIHRAVTESLHNAGFATGTNKHGNPFGMFHGTGHGVGLELHDPGPRTISQADCILQPGMVTSVEPGLYYPSNINGGTGGCRIEDLTVITTTGYQNLTTLGKSGWIFE